MNAVIYDGKAESQKVLNSIAGTIDKLGITPSLSIIQIGNNKISTSYVQLKRKRGEEVGIDVAVSHFPENSTRAALVTYMKEHAIRYSGHMVQLPIPGADEEQSYLDLIPQEMDVDGLCTKNLAAIATGTALFIPAVVRAVEHSLTSLLSKTQHRSVVVLGSGKHVGKPIYDHLHFAYSHHAYTLVNEYTKNIASHIATADVVISCIGKAQVYSAEMLKKGAVLVDVGTSLDTDGKIKGDFEITNKAHETLSMYTPVPGGIGPLTVAYLLQNTLDATQVK